MPLLPSLMLLMHALLLLVLSVAGTYLVIRTAVVAKRALGVLDETRALNDVSATIQHQSLELLQRLAAVVEEAEDPTRPTADGTPRLH